MKYVIAGYTNLRIEIYALLLVGFKVYKSIALFTRNEMTYTKTVLYRNKIGLYVITRVCV
jgi:hypothetical protein